MSQERFTVEVLQRGIELYEEHTGHRPSHIQMTYAALEELKCDPYFKLCTEIQHPCAEYELRGVMLVVNNASKYAELRMK